MEILFTVITVTYNAEKTLLRTLQSVQGQTYPHIEHIIVDGNSTDGTVQLIEEHATHYTQWVSEKDQGIYDAMNKATAMARGNYICYLNAGDTFYNSSSVEEVVAIAIEHQLPDILYGETVVVDSSGSYLYDRRLRAPSTLHWKSFKQGMLVCHQAFIIHRALFKPYDLTYRFSSDVDWCIRLMKRSKSRINTERILIRYLNEGVTTANRQASLRERFHIMVKHYGWISTLLHHAWFVVRAVIKPEKK